MKDLDSPPGGRDHDGSRGRGTASFMQPECRVPSGKRRPPRERAGPETLATAGAAGVTRVSLVPLMGETRFKETTPQGTDREARPGVGEVGGGRPGRGAGGRTQQCCQSSRGESWAESTAAEAASAEDCPGRGCGQGAQCGCYAPGPRSPFPHQLLRDPENLGDGLAGEGVPGDVSMRDCVWGGGLRGLGQLPPLLGELSCHSEPHYPHLND